MTLETLERLVDTYLFYSYPSSVFAFQGGEPTLAGLEFFEKLVEFQQRHGRGGQSVANALRTNAVLIDQGWCDLFRQYNWLLGVSLDGPEEINDIYRFNKEHHGTWKRVMQSVELLQSNKVEFNILCVLNAANVEKPKELYRFYRKLGVDNVQFIPLAEFDAEGKPRPFTITPEQYGRFLCEVFEWGEIARRTKRYSFASKKTLAHPECQVCEYQSVCHGGCPKFRHGPNGRFDDLDYFCAAYKMIFGRAVEPLRAEVKRLLGRDVPELGRQAISPY